MGSSEDKKRLGIIKIVVAFALYFIISALSRRFNSTVIITVASFIFVGLIIWAIVDFLSAKKMRKAEEEAAAESYRKALQAEKQAKEEKAAQERAAILNEKIEKATRELAEIPRVEIATDGVKTELVDSSFVDDIKFATIRKSDSIERLGRFVVIDIETTGLNPKKHDIIEVAAIKVDGWDTTDCFTTFVRPPRGLVEAAQAVNGITEDMVANAPLFYQILPSLQEYIKGYNLVGHNLVFDLGFLAHYGLDIMTDKRKFYCTKILASTVLSTPYKHSRSYDVFDYKLETLCRYYGITRVNSHRALSDCIDTAYLFNALAQEKIK